MSKRLNLSPQNVDAAKHGVARMVKKCESPSGTGSARSDSLCLVSEKRMGEDSNPRRTFALSGFQDRRLRPLGHPSGTWKCRNAWQYSRTAPCDSESPITIFQSSSASFVRQGEASRTYCRTRIGHSPKQGACGFRSTIHPYAPADLSWSRTFHFTIGLLSADPANRSLS